MGPVRQKRYAPGHDGGRVSGRIDTSYPGRHYGKEVLEIEERLLPIYNGDGGN